MERRAMDWVRRTIDSQAGGPVAGSSKEEPEAIQTFIDQGVECQGSLRLKVSARIDGEFRGDIETEATLVVGEFAGVEAHLRAREVVISGAVVGNVTASRSVVLRAGARLHGDVESPSLVIERGAVFNGRSLMTRPLAGLREDEPAAGAEAPVPVPAAGW